MMSHLILIVSNPPIPDVSKYFASDIYDVQLATSAESMISFLTAHAPAVVIVDAKSVGMNAQDIRRLISLPHQAKEIPSIWLLERGDERKHGFGGDLDNPLEDYVTKPYDVEELELRVQNSIRRRQYGK